MAAPPSFISVDDDDDDDGFDWEAAVREIDSACALASSYSGPTHAPHSHPSEALPSHPIASSSTSPSHRASARQSTLDRFVECFTRRQQSKEKQSPAVAAVPAVVVAGGRGSFAARSDEGCSRRSREELSEGPCAVALDHEAVQTLIYPTNVQVREYQQNIVQKALFTNTLVALPTGLGKTFIAAVVMYNYFRWFPEGKIVFTAPSRPLVTQQIEACHNTVGIPQKWTIDMKGNLSPTKRSSFWKSKRVFFVTPQILENDIQSGICMVKQLVCLVIDEAHRASGNHSYCISVRELVASCVPLRILALTATPGSKLQDIQGVINNLHISELVHCDESDPEVKRYVNKRKIDLLKVPVGSDTAQVNDMILDVIRPHLNRLRAAGVIDNRDAANWTQHQLLVLRDKFNQAPPPNLSFQQKNEIRRSFAALGSLCHVSKMLLSLGIESALQSIKAKLSEGQSWNFVSKDETFARAMNMMNKISCQCVPSPKVQKLVEVLVDHFQINALKNSRVIIFSNFRESVREILCSLKCFGDELVRPTAFTGQSSAGDRLKGQTQKVQQAILQKFRSGEYNTLVATSIGEEGLDIMEVDLVICFDANISPLRMIQRMGRTGRKHEGRVVVLACEGQELKGYLKKQGNAQTMKKLLRNRDFFEFHASPRMVPHVYKPEIKSVKLSIEKYISYSKRIKVDISSASSIFNKISEEDGQLIARYFSACKQDTWKPSLVAFPSFQVSPCDIYKVPHSLRTTAMLIDAMQQLQDLPFSRAKCGSLLQELDITAVKDQALEGHHFSSGEVACSKSVCVPSSPVKKYCVHSFYGGDYVAVDVSGYVLITYVPTLPMTSVAHKVTRNENWEPKSQNKSTPSKFTTHVSVLTADDMYSSKPISEDYAINFAPHSPDFSVQCNLTDSRHIPLDTPSKTSANPREKWGTPCNAKLASPTLSHPDDMELSPRLTHYIEEGIVPESPILEVSHQLLQVDNAADVNFVSMVSSSMAHSQRAQANGLECLGGPMIFEEKGQNLARITEHHGPSIENVLDQIQGETKVTMCPSNANIYSPAAHNPTANANLRCDSLSDDWQRKSVGDTSGSVQQAPKYRRLCKHGEKIKRVCSVSLNDRYDESLREQCDLASKSTPSRMKRVIGNTAKANKRMDIYVDEEVEVSEDADISANEDDDPSDDKYEDSFIDDQTTPGKITESEQDGENAGDMMAFYRRSLLTQSTVVLPSRYSDISDSSASIAESASCSSGNLLNPITLGIPQTFSPSPRLPRQSSFIKLQGEASVLNCESTSKLDCRKRKLSFQQAASIPLINLEPERAAETPSHFTAEVNDNIYWDDAFFESLDLDAIEAQATEQLRLQKTESPQNSGN